MFALLILPLLDNKLLFSIIAGFALVALILRLMVYSTHWKAEKPPDENAPGEDRFYIMTGSTLITESLMYNRAVELMLNSFVSRDYEELLSAMPIYQSIKPYCGYYSILVEVTVPRQCVQDLTNRNPRAITKPFPRTRNLLRFTEEARRELAAHAKVEILLPENIASKLTPILKRMDANRV